MTEPANAHAEGGMTEQSPKEQATQETCWGGTEGEVIEEYRTSTRRRGKWQVKTGARESKQSCQMLHRLLKGLFYSFLGGRVVDTRFLFVAHAILLCRPGWP